MKKIFGFLLFLSFCSLVDAQNLESKKNYFNSAYIGIGGDVLYVSSDVKNVILDRKEIEKQFDNDITNYTSAIRNNNAANFDFSGSILVGFGRKFESFYFGSDLFFKYFNVNIDKTTNQNTYSKNIYSTVKLSSNNFYGFDVKFGHLIDNKSIFYFLIGGEFGNFKYRVFHVNEDVPNKYKYSFNKTVPALRVGMGIETFLHKNLALRFEYSYSDYKVFKYQKEISEEITSTDPSVKKIFYDSFADNKVNPSSGSLSLNLVYHIDT